MVLHRSVTIDIIGGGRVDVMILPVVTNYANVIENPVSVVGIPLEGTAAAVVTPVVGKLRHVSLTAIISPQSGSDTYFENKSVLTLDQFIAAFNSYLDRDATDIIYRLKRWDESGTSIIEQYNGIITSQEINWEAGNQYLTLQIKFTESVNYIADPTTITSDDNSDG